MKKSRFLLLIFLVLLVISVGLSSKTNFFNNIIDSRIWSMTKSDLKNNEVLDIIIQSGENIELTGDAKDVFLEELLNAKFHSSNWRHFGPTGVPVIIQFAGGKNAIFVWWGGYIFESLGYGRQFLVSSEALGQLMKQYYGDFK